MQSKRRKRGFKQSIVITFSAAAAGAGCAGHHQGLDADAPDASVAAPKHYGTGGRSGDSADVDNGRRTTSAMDAGTTAGSGGSGFNPPSLTPCPALPPSAGSGCNTGEACLFQGHMCEPSMEVSCVNGLWTVTQLYYTTSCNPPPPPVDVDAGDEDAGTQ